VVFAGFLGIEVIKTEMPQRHEGTNLPAIGRKETQGGIPLFVSLKLYDCIKFPIGKICR